MSLVKTVTLVINNQTVAEATTLSLANSTAIDTETCLSLAIEVVMTFHASATAGAKILLFGSGDDTNYGTVPFDEIWVTTAAEGFAAGATTRVSRAIIPAQHYIKAAVQNLDAAQDITAISAWSHVQTG